MKRPRLDAAALAALALLSACRRKEAPPASAPAQAEAPQLAPWDCYELGSLLVIEGELAEGTNLYLRGATLLEHRDAEAGPVRWEVYKPAQRETVELQDSLGRVLARWDVAGLRAPGEPLILPSQGRPNNQPTEDQVASLASRITWTNPQEAPPPPAPEPPRRSAPEPTPRVSPVTPPRVGTARPRDLPGVADPRSPRALPEATPKVQPVAPPRIALGRPSAGPQAGPDPRAARPLPDPTPKVGPVTPPRVTLAQPSAGPQAGPDPRAARPLPEATPKVAPVAPPRVTLARPSGGPQAGPDPRAPRELPEATPKVRPVVPPRPGTVRPAAGPGATAEPRATLPLPEPTPEVHPVVPGRTPLPGARRPLEARLEPVVPAPLPDGARPAPHLPSEAWPGAGEALNLIRGPRTGKRLVLTFDGGSSAEVAGEVLDILRAKGIRTTFFLTGAFIQKFPDLVRRMDREGHEIGNHTQNHPHFAPNMRRDPAWTQARIQEELLSADRALYRLLGRPMEPYWRAPYGEQTAEIRRWAEELGYRHIGWSEGADTLDWATPAQRKLYRTGDAILTRLHAKLVKDGEGLIVLMHLGSEREEEDRPSKGLGPWIERAQREGWSFVSVGQVLRQMGKPAWNGQVRVSLLQR